MRGWLTLALAVAPLALVPARADAPAPALPALAALPATPVRYRIDARLEPAAGEVSGRLELGLRNTSALPLSRTLLHLYLNAFASPETIFMRGSGGHLRLSSWDPGAPGWIKVSELRQEGALASSRPLEDGTVLEVQLPRAVPPGGELHLSLSFRGHLPGVFARTGREGDFFMVAQWYPKPGVLLPDGSWRCAPYHARAEFFAEFASYEVTLRTPPGYLVGATGHLRSRRVEGGEQVLEYRAAAVHDFAWSAWPSFTEERRTIDGVAVRLLSVPGRGQSARQLRALEGALPRLQRWLGRYPYGELTVIDPPTRALGAGAMEYPTLFATWVPWWAPEAARFFDETVVHELVHQWFQGLVANDEVEEPWLDEGVTSYVAGVVLDELFGPSRSLLDLGPLALGNHAKERLRVVGPRPDALPVGWPGPRYNSWYDYGRTAYARGALLLATVESLLGREAMRDALAAYVREHSFRHPRSADLEAALLSRAPDGARERVRELLDGVLRRGAGLDVGLTCERDAVTVQRRGSLALPLELSVHDASGTRQVRLDGRAAETRVTAPGLRSAALGPAGRLALDRTPIDDACVPRASAARPAATWASALQQLLQVLGP